VEPVPAVKQQITSKIISGHLKKMLRNQSALMPKKKPTQIERPKKLRIVSSSMSKNKLMNTERTAISIEASAKKSIR
jgi:hypothetical protein